MWSILDQGRCVTVTVTDELQAVPANSGRGEWEINGVTVELDARQDNENFAIQAHST